MGLYAWLHGNIVVFLRSQRKSEIIMLRDGTCSVPGLFKLKKVSPQRSKDEMLTERRNKNNSLSDSTEAALLNIHFILKE